MSTPKDNSESQLEFAWNIHSYTNEHIRFSDTKAALVIAFSSGLLASLFAQKGHDPIRNARFAWYTGMPIDWEFTGLVIKLVFAFLFLAGSILLAIFSILPRLRSQPPGDKKLLWWLESRWQWVMSLFVRPSGPEKAPIYWASILGYGNLVDYQAAIKAMEASAQIDAVAAHLYILAGITNEKFRLVNQSIALSLFGGAFASWLILMRL